MEEILLQYADRSFVYAVCAYLLYMNFSVVKETKKALADLTTAVKEFGTLVRERLK